MLLLLLVCTIFMGALVWSALTPPQLGRVVGNIQDVLRHRRHRVHRHNKTGEDLQYGSTEFSQCHFGVQAQRRAFV
jgi:hypothetical protein